MAHLPTPVAIHILQGLACFDTPEQVAASVKVNFGLVLTRQRIEAWHPERRAGAKLGAHWREMFYETRAKLLAEMENIPIACRSYRLILLQRMADRAEAAGNLPLAIKVLEQAARETSEH
ncbi:DUF2280 domain-containing protein [Pseudoduganella sp. FT55W]|uniref:DUF2280 domain-containing protein n=1 Tax=Duganella rivi TaxID=2666083 RepID=A0A7X4KDH8_9BURK|nr:DUF2280 domain-containing protein [Duganella rivi]MYM69250.1 DUF2280 domain-containing protein [Duganella rivi]